MSDLVGNPEDRFSHNEAQMLIDLIKHDRINERTDRQSVNRKIKLKTINNIIREKKIVAYLNLYIMPHNKLSYFSIRLSIK